ncbi:MAG: glycosyltransferase family 1 protein, partial [Acidobacteria bacterium ACB1]|nr:glycosyltransferase family 1 protein [Acidobacteria bacterium ACB1]
KAFEMVRGYVKRIGLLRRLDEYDAVFVYREAALLGPAILERLIARRKPIIYQLDDPLFVPYKSPSNGYLSYLKFFGKIKEIIRISSVVIVNSTAIRQYAEQFNTNIWQIPSLVDSDLYAYDPTDQDADTVCVGWSGSPTTIKNIKMVEEPLRRISAGGLCKISLIGADDFNLTDVIHTAKKWNSNTEVDDLRAMQIGLVPLPADNPWNPFKFIMKTAQYMTLGIVPVGTPSASNSEVIRHGENGFLAANDNEWFDHISQLASDGKMRREMSHQAAQDAIANYTLAANREKIVNAFRSVVGA